MTKRSDLLAWQPHLLADLADYRARRGVVATVRRLRRRGVSLPLAVLLVLGVV